MTHTPGPWEYMKQWGEVKTVNGMLGMDTSELIPVTVLGIGKNTDSNGYLIAASPDLFEACKAIFNATATVDNPDFIAALAMVEKAIKKAEGTK